MVGGNVMSLLIFAVVGIVALLIYGQIDTTTTQSLISSSTAARAAQANFSASTYGGYQTISVGPTILAAVVVLGIITTLMTFGRR